MGQISKVGVVGLGTMGAGIVEVVARSGFDVIGVDISDAAIDRGRGRVEGSLARALERGKITEAERDETLARIRYSTDIAALADRDLVIEAVPEDLALKAEIMATLDAELGAEAIMATNTSSLSVTQIAVATSRPNRVVGMHFFNPAPVLGFMEIVRTVVAGPEVIEAATAFGESLGKTPVVVGDRAGFIANALLFGYLNHAASMYEARYASREDIDAAMRLGCGYPMGPLALLDLIGLDTAYQILDTMYREGRDRLHAPSPIIKQMVTAGMKGRKTGAGFYTYAAAGLVHGRRGCADPGRRWGARRRATGEPRGRGRFGHDGHGHHRGLRQGGDRHGVRRPLAGEGRRGEHRARALPGQGRAARQAHRGGPGAGAGPSHRHDHAR